MEATSIVYKASWRHFPLLSLLSNYKEKQKWLRHCLSSDMSTVKRSEVVGN